MNEEIRHYYDNPRVKDSHRRICNAFAKCNSENMPVWEFTSDPIFPLEQVMLEKEAMLAQALHNIHLTMQYETDFCPVLYPWFGTGVYAQAFGAEIVPAKNDYPWTKHGVHTVQEAQKLKKPKAGEPLFSRKVLEAIEYFKQETQSYIPITCTDPQSPFSIIAELWEPSDLFINLYEEPQTVHAVLSMITDYFIEFTQMQMSHIENIGLPGFNFPLGDGRFGISVCDDYATMLSPEAYKEFCVPYLQRISDAFGGICIHSCGNYLHNLPNMMEIRGLKALNYHCSEAEMDSDKARAIIADRCAVYTAPSVPSVGFKSSSFNSQEEIFLRYFLPRCAAPYPHNTIITGFGTYWGSSHVSSEQQTAQYRLIQATLKEFRLSAG